MPAVTQPTTPAVLHSAIKGGLKASRDLLDFLEKHPKMWAMVNDADVYEFLWMKKALDESVKLQSHYAELLNMHDGGRRSIFGSTRRWIERLIEMQEKNDASSTTKGS